MASPKPRHTSSWLLEYTEISQRDHVLIDLEQITATRYRYRGSVIPSPWPTTDAETTTAA